MTSSYQITAGEGQILDLETLVPGLMHRQRNENEATFGRSAHDIDRTKNNAPSNLSDTCQSASSIISTRRPLASSRKNMRTGLSSSANS